MIYYFLKTFFRSVAGDSEHFVNAFSLIHHDLDVCTNLFKLVQTCSNLFKLVQTCSNLFKLVQTCSNLFKLVQTCSNLYKLVQTCSNLFKHVQTCSNLFLNFFRSVAGDSEHFVNAFSLIHHDLDVCTNSLQYSMILDVLNNLMLYIEPR
jgi:hypothetical protein